MRKRISAETKIALLGRHLLEGERAYKLAQEVGIDASTFHRWQRRFLRFSLRYGADAFRRRPRNDRSDPLWEMNALLRRLSKL